jgi:hypothetical protein
VRPIVRSKYEPKETPNDRLIQLQHISAYNVGEQRWVLLGESSAAAVRLLRVDDPSCVYPDGKEGVAP